MCGRFTLTSDMDTVLFRFSAMANPTINHLPKYNIAPTQSVLAVVNDGQQNQLKEFKWGLIPFWAKDPKIGSKIINARCETLTEKPSFKHLIKQKRCLIPATGFFEWKTTEQKKQPFLIKLINEEMFSFAGLWDTWQSPTGNLIFSCTIITTVANDAISKIHNRMPVILSHADEEIWLDQAETDSLHLTSLLKPLPSEKITMYQVSTIVNSPRNETPECIEPLSKPSPSQD